MPQSYKTLIPYKTPFEHKYYKVVLVSNDDFPLGWDWMVAQVSIVDPTANRKTIVLTNPRSRELLSPDEIVNTTGILPVTYRLEADVVDEIENVIRYLSMENS